MDRFDVPNRIKKYRSLLGISQSQLAGNKLSLSLIKSIESGRRNLTPLKANEIVESIKKIALSKDICIDIDASEFLMSNKDYARNYCLKKLDILCNSHDEKEYEDLINIANEYDLDDIKINIYTKLSEYYFNAQQYSITLELNKKVYNISEKTNDIRNYLLALFRIGACHLCLGDMENSILYMNKCYSILHERDIHDSYIESRLFYNFAAYYKKIDDFKTALEWIEKAILMSNHSKQMSNHCLLFKGNIILRMGKYKDALNIYEYLLEHDTRFIHIIYNNMAEAFYKLKDQEKSIEYLNHSINIQLKNDEATITISLLSLGKIYYEKMKYTEAIIFYQYALDSCIKNKQPEYIFTCCNRLLNLYKTTNKLVNFQIYVTTLIKIYIKNTELKKKFSCFLYVIVKYLLQSNLF